MFLNHDLIKKKKKKNRKADAWGSTPEEMIQTFWGWSPSTGTV